MKIPRVPDDKKMRELIIYVAEASAKDERFGATKLNKILFYADFLSYLKRGQSITGQEYFALGEGPAPKRLIPIRETMIEKGDIALKKANHFGFPQERVIALRSPDYDRLDAEDVAIVNFVIGKLWEMNGKEVSEKSHEFVGWKLAFGQANKTVISYSLARFDLKSFFVDTPELPPALVNHGKALFRKSRTDSGIGSSLAAA